MKRMTPLILAVVLCISTKANSQTAQPVKPLSIGDKMPDIALNEMMNYPKTEEKLSTFEDKKLLILDMWSTSCSACIGLFPHMEELSKEFKDDLQIVLVNSKTTAFHDNKTKINKLLQRLKVQSDENITLPIVLNCKQLDDYFPWRTIPMEIWVNQNGVVIAITGAREVNESNIGAIIEGRKVSMHTKKDSNIDLSTHSLSELVSGLNQSENQLVFSSVVIKGMIDGLGGSEGTKLPLQKDKKIHGFFMTNQSLLSIYRSVYRDKLNYPANRILIEAKDPERFQQIDPSDTSWYSNVYSIDITVPPSTPSEVNAYVSSEIDHLFHTKVTKGKRNIECYILKASPAIAKSYAKGGPLEYQFTEGKTGNYFQNYPVEALVSQLNQDVFKIPLINETGLKTPVTFDYPYKVMSEQKMIEALKDAGFEIKKENRMLDVGIISDYQ